MAARKTVKKGRRPATKKNTRLRSPGRKITRKSTRKKSTSKRRK